MVSIYQCTVCKVNIEAGKFEVCYMDKNNAFRTIEVYGIPQDFKLVVTGADYKEPDKDTERVIPPIDFKKLGEDLAKYYWGREYTPSDGNWRIPMSPTCDKCEDTQPDYYRDWLRYCLYIDEEKLRGTGKSIEQDTNKPKVEPNSLENLVDAMKTIKVAFSFRDEDTKCPKCGCDLIDAYVSSGDDADIYKCHNCGELIEVDEDEDD